MTKTNLNAKQTKASGADELLTPCPPPTIPFRVRWLDGVPMIPDGMEPEEFFDLTPKLSDEEIMIRIRTEEAEAEAEAEAAYAASLGVLENYRPNETWTKKNALKMISREELLLRYKMMAFVKDALRSVCSWKSPVMNCSITPIGDIVTISQTNKDGKLSAKFSPLVHDKNTWICPLCSFKIAVGRAKQIREVVYRSKKQNEETYHMTITMAHNHWEKLGDMLKDMKKALKYFWESGSVKRLFKKYFKYRITAMEITMGFDEFSNGWHPHFHVLLIGQKNVPFKEVQDEFSEMWLKALNRVGHTGKDGIALQVKPCKDIEDYLTKLPCEIALFNVTKHGHGCHMTFFQMVAYAVKSGSSAIREQIAEYVREYYKATRKKHQLQMSRGLLKHYEVEDISDEALAEQKDEDVVKQLLVVCARAWKKRLDHEDIAQIWLLARRGAASEIVDFIHKKGIYDHWANEDDYRRWHNKFYGGE